MMNNLFSHFDPNSFFINPLIIISVSLMFVTYMNNMLMMSQNFYFKGMKYLFKEFKTNSMLKFKNETGKMFFFMMMIILCVNVLSINSYTWGFTSQILINSMMILTFFMGIVITIFKNFKMNFLIHLIPSGTPFILIPLMIIIELISILIRPLTLTIRLTSNIMAGHILLSIISGCLNKMIYSKFFSILMLPLIIMIMLEIMVSFIQSYIIFTLLSLYISEV